MKRKWIITPLAYCAFQSLVHAQAVVPQSRAEVEGKVVSIDYMIAGRTLDSRQWAQIVTKTNSAVRTGIHRFTRPIVAQPRYSTSANL